MKTTTKTKMGMIEQVKAGTITAHDALAKMTARIKKSKGQKGLAVFQGSHAFTWLSRRAA